MRKIIHIDMDAFYASVEQRDFPEYRGKPLIVGGSPEGRGGVVATASYEARKFGVRSAMSSKRAQQLCPQGIFVFPRFDAYKAVSADIRAIFHRYTDLIEPLSLDEAYLDVTRDKLNIGSAMDIAEQIRTAIRNELQLTASAGVSINKFVAKIASDMKKPDGLTFIGPSRVESFIEALPVASFHGVGKVTAEKMKKLGLHTGADIKQLTEAELVRHFGKTGHFYYKIARGIDDRPVQPHRETKSLAAEETFAYDLTALTEMNGELARIAETLAKRLAASGLCGRTITVKIKYADFTQITRSRSFPEPIGKADGFAIQSPDVSGRLYQILLEVAMELLAGTEPEGKPVRLLGISVSNFENARPDDPRPGPPGQLALF